MRLLGLRFRHVGPFGAQGISLDGLTPGLNVICETNEFGKSTVVESLKIFLFKPFSSSDKFVKALASKGSDAGPEGEIAFEVDGQSYTLTKRFLKRKMCELRDGSGAVIATDREADEHLGLLINGTDRDRGPSGLLWIEQGTSMDPVSDDGQVASRLEGELTTLVGGDRARDYLARVERELSENMTSRGPKKNGPLDLALSELSQLESDLGEARRLRDITHEIGQTLETVRDKRERLERDTDPAGTEAEIQATREKLAVATLFESQVQALRLQRDRASELALQAGDRQTASIESLTLFNRWTDELDLLLSGEGEKRTALEQALARRIPLLQAVDELEEITARYGLDRQAAEAFTKLKHDLESTHRDATHLSTVHEHHLDLDGQVQALNDRLSDLPPVRRADVDPLRRMSERVRQCRSDLDALSTRLYLDLDTGASGKISIAGQPLISGSFELSGGDILKIEGIGQLRGDDRRARDLKAEQVESEAAFAETLETLGVADVTEAAQAADLRHDLEAEQKRLVSEMAKLAPQGFAALEADKDALERRLRALSERLADMSEMQPDDTGGETQIRDRCLAARAKLQALDETINALRLSVTAQGGKIETLKTRLNDLRLPETDAARTAQADELAGEKLKADAALRLSNAAIEKAESTAPTQSLDTLKSRLTRLEQAGRQTREQLEQLKQQEASLQARRDAAFEGEDADAKVASLEARRDVQMDAVAKLRQRVAAQTLLRDTLQASQSRLRDAYTEPVRAELAPLLAMVLPGAEAGLGEALGADTVSRNGRVEDLAQLSGGTREQIAILTRLAFARLLKRGGADAPVILDDALVYADDKRRDDMFDVLNYVSAGEDGLQLIYLSCHASATRGLGGHAVSVSSWPEP